MEKVIGLITANYKAKKASVLSNARPVASLPYLGRYRVVDFALSNMVNCGIRTVGMIMPYNYRSLMDHVGSGRDWDLNRKKGGLFMLPGSAYGTSRSGARFLLRDLIQNKSYIARGKSDLIILSSASFVYNVDYSELVDAHRANGTDITVLTKTARKADVDVTGFVVEEGRVTGRKDGVSEGDVASLDCIVMGREFLLQLLDWYKENDFLDLFEAISEAGDFGRVSVSIMDYKGYAAAIFNADAYFASNMDLLDPKVLLEVFPVARPVKTKAHDNAPAKFETGSKVTNSAVAGSCRISGTVTNSILGRSVVVEKGAVVNNAIVMQSCVIKSGAVVENAIIDRNNVVSAGVELKGTPESLFIKEKAAE